jgi:hypothetical protein
VLVGDLTPTSSMFYTHQASKNLHAFQLDRFTLVAQLQIMFSQDGPHDLCLNVSAGNIWASGYHQAEESAEDILDMIGDARATMCANQSFTCTQSCSAPLVS